MANAAKKISEDNKICWNIQEKNQQQFLENQLKCSICLELYVKATIAIAHERISEQNVRRCGHTFCEDCINTSMRTNSSKCPLCRSRIILTTTNHALEIFINQFVDTHFSNEAKIARANLLKEREEAKMKSYTEAENRVPRGAVNQDGYLQHNRYRDINRFISMLESTFDQESNQETNQDESSDSDDSIPSLGSPFENNNIDYNANGDENIENVGQYQRLMRRNGITDEMVREGVFANLEENHLDDESDWEPEVAIGGRGYIVNMPNMETMANIQQALDSFSRNSPMPRLSSFDDSLPDIEAAVEGAAYSHMRYQRRLQVPGVFVTEGHNSLPRQSPNEGGMDREESDTLTNNFDADESNIIDASTNGDENNDDIRVIGNIEPIVHSYVQWMVRESRYDMGYDLMRDGVQENHDENHVDDESSDDSDDIPDLVDIVDNTDGAGNEDDEVDNSDDDIPDHVDIVDNTDDVGNDDDEVDNSDVNSDDVGCDPDRVDNTDDVNDESVINSDDVGPDQINVDNTDDVNDDDDVDNMDNWFLYVSRLKISATT